MAFIRPAGLKSTSSICSGDSRPAVPSRAIAAVLLTYTMLVNWSAGMTSRLTLNPASLSWDCSCSEVPVALDVVSLKLRPLG